MLPRPRPKVVTPNDDGPKPGLARLVQALRADSIEHRARETLPAVRARLEFCSLWLPGDTAESFQERVGRWTRSAIYSRLSKIRLILGSPKYQQLDPYSVAQAYLAKHARFRSDIITEV